MKLKHPTHWLESKPALAWTLAALYAILIFILSSFPYEGPPQPALIAGVSPTYKHILEYALFSFLLLACFRSKDKTKRFALLLAIFTAGLYGVTDEFHQLFVPGRVASLYDIAANFVGGFFGAILTKPRAKLE